MFNSDEFIGRLYQQQKCLSFPFEDNKSENPDKDALWERLDKCLRL